MKNNPINILDGRLTAKLYLDLSISKKVIIKISVIQDIKKELIEYIDYYNNKRIKGKLKGMSPVNYRIHSLKLA